MLNMYHKIGIKCSETIAQQVKINFRHIFFLPRKPKTPTKNRKCPFFTVTYILTYYFLKCHTVIFSFFLAFLVSVKKNNVSEIDFYLLGTSHGAFYCYLMVHIYNIWFSEVFYGSPFSLHYIDPLQMSKQLILLL